MELDTTKNLTKISNKDGTWFSEHSLETVKSVWKKKEGHIYLNQDAIEDILTDLLKLDEGESIYIKRDGNKYLCNIEGKVGHGFCVLSIGEALIKILKK